MWNRKYVKLQGITKHRSSTGSESWKLGICLIMEELPTGNLWALPIVPVPQKASQGAYGTAGAGKPGSGDGYFQIPKAWRSCSSLIRWARALCSYNKLLWLGSSLRVCRKKHCSCIPKTSVHIYQGKEQPDHVRSLTKTLKYFHMMHIHPPHRWEAMLRSGTILSEKFSKIQKWGPNCSNIKECKVQQRRCKMEIKEGIMSFAEKSYHGKPMLRLCGHLTSPGSKMVQFSQIRPELITKESSGQGTVPPTAQESSCRGSLHYNWQDLSMVSHQLASEYTKFLQPFR